MQSTSEKVKNLALAGVFAALTCVATMAIRIPSPIGGYVNLGDTLVLLSGFLLGPIWGSAAAGIGSMAGDLFGYPHYAAGTLVIKAAVALTAALLYRRLRSSMRESSHIPQILASVCGEAVMIVGYFFYSSLLLGKGMAALQSVTGNLMQALAGIILANLLLLALRKTSFFQKRL